MSESKPPYPPPVPLPPPLDGEVARLVGVILAAAEADVRPLVRAMLGAEDVAGARPHAVLPVVDRLLVALRDDDEAVRRKAALAVEEVGPAALANVVRTFLESADPGYKAGLIDLVGRIGARDRAQTVPALAGMVLGQSDPAVVRAAVRAVAAIGAGRRDDPGLVELGV